MSREDGWAAIHLDAPPRVPRTEYSADSHWDLVAAVTGRAVGPQSSAEAREEARRAFIRQWNYDFVWSTLIHGQVIQACRTDMGHAEYAADGSDRRDTVSCPFADVEQVLDFEPEAVYGQPDVAEWTERFNAHYAQNVKANPNAVNMTGIYITLISGLIDIFGWDMLLTALGTDPERFGQVADRYGAWITPYFEALAACNAPVVMVHDDIVWTSGAFYRPEWYRRFVFPNYRKLFVPLIDAGKRIAYTSDGNYTEFIDDVAACGIHGFVLEPIADMGYIAQRYGRTHFFIGNADTRILLSGTPEAIREEVKRCMDIGRACPGFFMAVGNHIPPNTPVENALIYNAAYEELARR